MDSLSREVIRIAQQRYSKAINAGKLLWSKFPDGWPNIAIENVGMCSNFQATFLAAMERPADVFEQLAVVYALPRYLVRSLQVIMPYFPVGTMERKVYGGEIVTAMTLSRMLSQIPLNRPGGPAKLVFFDIHALPEEFYLRDGVVVQLVSAMPLFQSELSKLDAPAIAFPDEGAMNRFGKMFNAYDLIVCGKKRNGNQRDVRIISGDPSKRHVCIIDDLVQTGGTLIECNKALRNAGARSVSAAVTHGVFPNESWKRIIEGEICFDNFWITDSCPTTAQAVIGKKPFEVISLSDVIVDLVVNDSMA
jgi:ribose-phosphate pyrophosphokinase